MSHGLKILKEKENLLLNRKEIVVEITSDITPSIKDAEKAVGEKFSKAEDHVKIKTIKGTFGSNDFKITANVYHSKEHKERNEPKIKEKKTK
jgi:ribosomal protein S24E